jgi:hypothetical protein
MLIALLLLAGLVELYFGAEWLVRGGASLAVWLGVTPVAARRGAGAAGFDPGR